MAAVEEAAPVVGIKRTCAALGLPRATLYRRRTGPGKRPAGKRRSPERSLSPEERQEVLDHLSAPRFVDLSPAEVYATLLDEGVYVCSIRTMYRILKAQGEVKERRDQLRHPSYHQPELLATGPNELWSWDITKLRGPAKWTYFYLYVIVDVFSRFVVGWAVFTRESAALAQELIRTTAQRQGIEVGQLTLHADRGAAMTSKPVAFLLADLGITKTHSRPHVSNDNPYSEAQFKTLKYHPEFPDRFGSVLDARAFCQKFFRWYNQEHRHSGIGLMTPAAVHTGQAHTIRQRRQAVLTAAYAAHPERFVHHAPEPPALPAAVWINKPAAEDAAD